MYHQICQNHGLFRGASCALGQDSRMMMMTDEECTAKYIKIRHLETAWPLQIWVGRAESPGTPRCPVPLPEPIRDNNVALFPSCYSQFSSLHLPGNCPPVDLAGLPALSDSPSCLSRFLGLIAKCRVSRSLLGDEGHRALALSTGINRLQALGRKIKKLWKLNRNRDTGSLLGLVYMTEAKV